MPGGDFRLISARGPGGGGGIANDDGEDGDVRRGQAEFGFDGRQVEPRAGKSARLIVTMGMPALWYRWFFLAHGIKGLERNILNFCGVRPVRESYIGLVEAENGTARARWLDRVAALGRRAR